MSVPEEGFNHAMSIKKWFPVDKTRLTLHRLSKVTLLDQFFDWVFLDEKELQAKYDAM